MFYIINYCAIVIPVGKCKPKLLNTKPIPTKMAVNGIKYIHTAVQLSPPNCLNPLPQFLATTILLFVSKFDYSKNFR